MQKADSNCSAGTDTDSEQKDRDIFVSQHRRKPLLPVVHLPQKPGKYFYAAKFRTILNNSGQIKSKILGYLPYFKSESIMSLCIIANVAGTIT